MSVLIFITLTHSNEPVVCRLSVIFQTVPTATTERTKKCPSFCHTTLETFSTLASSKSQQAQKSHSKVARFRPLHPLLAYRRPTPL
jgi:hypothetical protein